MLLQILYVVSALAIFISLLISLSNWLYEIKNSDDLNIRNYDNMNDEQKKIVNEVLKKI